MLDQLLPVIQPTDWPGADCCVHRPFFPNDPDCPLLVSLAKVTPSYNLNLTPETLAEQTLRQEVLEKRALQRWFKQSRNYDWKEIEIAEDAIPALGSHGKNDIASTILLSPSHLQPLHEYFGESQIGIIIPDRFTVITHPEIPVISRYGRMAYREATSKGAPLSPYCFISVEGEVLGYAHRSDILPDDDEDASDDPMLLGSMVLACAIVITANLSEPIEPDSLSNHIAELIRLSRTGESLAHQICRFLADSDLSPIPIILKENTTPVELSGTLIRCLQDFRLIVGDTETDQLRTLAAELANHSGTPETSLEDLHSLLLPENQSSH